MARQMCKHSESHLLDCGTGSRFSEILKVIHQVHPG